MALSAARLRVESFLVISAIKRSSNLASYSLRRSPLTSQVILSLLAWRPMASGEIM